MSSSLNQQFNQLSQMDQFKGMNQFMSNPQGPDDFVSLFYFYNFYLYFIQNPNLEMLDPNNMFYNQSNQGEKDKNFQDFNQQRNQDLINMMGNLGLDSNNENLFNPNQNDDNQHSLNQAFNQISQGNFNPFDSFGNQRQNDNQNNKSKGGKNNSKKNYNQHNDNNILGNMNSYMNPMLNMGIGQNLGAPNLDDNMNFINPMMLNNLNNNLLGNY